MSSVDGDGEIEKSKWDDEAPPGSAIDKPELFALVVDDAAAPTPIWRRLPARLPHSPRHRQRPGDQQKRTDCWLAIASKSACCRASTPCPRSIPLDVLYEDEAIAVVNVPGCRSSGERSLGRILAARWSIGSISS